MDHCDVAIVGAGPYGLSAAAYLRQSAALQIRVFGKPMDFWRRCVPPRMVLRSVWHATHIADPSNRLTLDEYVRATADDRLGEPIPVSSFIDYGCWYSSQTGLQPDPRDVTQISWASRRFRLTLHDGATVSADRVVMAIGIASFAYKPPIFSGIPPELAPHSSELRDYSALDGKTVIVIGGGQSALEAGAFLQQHGAAVEILMRQPMHCRKARFAWLGNPAWFKLLRGRGEVGPLGVSLIIQRPALFGRLPRRLQTQWDSRASKLGLSYRLAPELAPQTICAGQTVQEVRIVGGRLRLRLSDGSVRVVDCAVLATGYQIDLARSPLFSPEILERLVFADGYPQLDSGLESAFPGLHFTGALAAYSFGPLLRFVSGTQFAGSHIARRVRLTTRAKLSHRRERAVEGPAYAD
jgi:FAD-dependent urate hydroxylase